MSDTHETGCKAPYPDEGTFTCIGCGRVYGDCMGHDSCPECGDCHDRNVREANPCPTWEQARAEHGAGA